MRVLLLSTYDLGRQPFSLASPAAWLRAAGHEVQVADLAVGKAGDHWFRDAELIAISLPMHTATRLAARMIPNIRALNPNAQLCCYGLYAPLNGDYLRGLGVRHILGGEFEAGLVRIANGEAAGDEVQLERLQFLVPDRSGMPPLTRYTRLIVNGEARRAGYTEASRGCKHLCRHCPVVNVYHGAFRVVQPDVVLEDIRRQVAKGAQHITFGDPDFFNGPMHARRIVEALASEFPGLSYDVTIKIEHLLKHDNLLPVLKQTGCAFVTSAVESLDDSVLQKLEKGHTRADFVAVVRRMRDLELTLSPTFIPFTPWTSLESYRDLLRTLADEQLVENTGSVQLALRLLIPERSRLLELKDIRVQGFDSEGLLYRWVHRDPRVDELAHEALHFVHEGSKRQLSRRAIFSDLWRLVTTDRLPDNYHLLPRAAIPYLDEAWYC